MLRCVGEPGKEAFASSSNCHLLYGVICALGRVSSWIHNRKVLDNSRTQYKGQSCLPQVLQVATNNPITLDAPDIILSILCSAEIKVNPSLRAVQSLAFPASVYHHARERNFQTSIWSISGKTKSFWENKTCVYESQFLPFSVSVPSLPVAQCCNTSFVVLVSHLLCEQEFPFIFVLQICTISKAIGTISWCVISCLIQSLLRNNCWLRYGYAHEVNFKLGLFFFLLQTEFQVCQESDITCLVVSIA